MSGSRLDFYGLILAIGAILVTFHGLVQWEGGEYSIEFFETVQVCSFEGILGSHKYPVQYSGAATPSSFPSFRVQDVLTIQGVDDLGGPHPFLLHIGGRYEMLLAGLGGDGMAGGLSYNEINAVFMQEIPVEVVGIPFRITRQGNLYYAVHVTRINLLDPSQKPEPVKFSGVNTYSLKELPVCINMTSPGKGVILDLNAGERIRFKVDSSELFNFSIYELDPYSQRIILGSDSLLFEYLGTSIDNVMDVHEKGRYIFNANSKTNKSVIITLEPTSYPSVEPLFYIKSCGSSGSSGACTVSVYPQSMPRSFITGRTWSHGGAWTDNSHTFTTTLHEGDRISLSYNATMPIDFHLSGPNGLFLSKKQTHIYEFITIEQNGTHTFTFNIEPPRTAVVSFRCTILDHGKLEPDTSASFHSYASDNSTGYSFPPIFDEKKITGYLDLCSHTVRVFDLDPIHGDLVERKILVLNVTEDNVTKKYVLNLGVQPVFIVYPDGGDTKRGTYTLHDLVDAYDLGLQVEVTGFPYLQDINGSQYQMFHVNSIEIIERNLLPLTTKHSWSLVYNKHHQMFRSNVNEEFQVSFRVGYGTYPEGNGTMEHFYPVYLYPGETIVYSYNSSVPTQMGVYYSSNSPAIRSFDRSSSDDYFFYNNDYHSTGTLTITREGYYTFSFRATDPSEVFFDLYRVN